MFVLIIYGNALYEEERKRSKQELKHKIHINYLKTGLPNLSLASSNERLTAV